MGVWSTSTQVGFFRFARGLGGVNFRGGSLMKPSESKMRSRLRHTISLRTPLDCRQSQALQTSCEIKRRLFPGCASIISLIVLMSCLLTDLLRYVMIVSIPDTINHQELERKLILKKNCAEVVNLKFKRLLPVNGYNFSYFFVFFVRFVVKQL